MNLTNKILPAGIIGQKQYVLSCKPTDDPSVNIYLLSNMEQRLFYSLWNIKMSDKEGPFNIWRYKGEDYEALKIELLENFIENAESESDETIDDMENDSQSVSAHKEANTSFNADDFSDLVSVLDDRSLQMVMREIESFTLAKALKGPDLSVQEKFFSNMSERAVEMLKEDMDYMGYVSLFDIRESQEKILAIIRYLAIRGKIIVKNDAIISDISCMIKLDPNNALAYNTRGEIYFRLEKFDAAFSDFSRAIELDPNNADTQYKLGLLYNNGQGVSQDYSKAAEWFRKAAAQGHKQAKAYLANRSLSDGRDIGLAAEK